MTADAAGNCALRPWVRSSAGTTLGEAGARLSRVAVDGRGAGLVAWSEDAGGREHVLVGEEVGPGAWAAREPAAALGGSNGGVTIAAGPRGEALVAWVRADEPAEIHASVRGDDGVWRDPVPGEALSRPPGGIEPWAAVAGTGEAIVAFCQRNAVGRGTAIARRRPGGQEWERPRGPDDVVSASILFTNFPKVAANARGDAAVAWFQSNGGPLMAWASARRGTEGAFERLGRGDALSPPEELVDHPWPAVAPDGRVAVVWTQEDGAGAMPLYLATRDAGGPWARPRDLGDALTARAGRARDAQAVFGPKGELYVVWTRVDEDAIHAARRAPDGRWIEAGTRPARLSSPGKVAFAPALAVGPDGGAIAVWIEAEGKKPGRVVARRTGLDWTVWGPIEPLSPAGAPGVFGPSVAVGPGDRAIVGWSQGPLMRTRVALASSE
jgi:hypothetical protein